MDKKIIIYILLGILILGLLLLTFFPGIIQALKDSGNSETDKCAPEPGYTEQEWEEHMGHHPEIYKECL
ncbi:MAG: hypothetical protein Q8O84_01930 [Nanoarchaeota archaeon]|nr:hypothetical protein [Nanoarchaeota archaeon]